MKVKYIPFIHMKPTVIIPQCNPFFLCSGNPRFEKTEHNWWYGVKSGKDKQNQVGSFWYNWNLHIIFFLVRCGGRGQAS